MPMGSPMGPGMPPGGHPSPFGPAPLGGPPQGQPGGGGASRGFLGDANAFNPHMWAHSGVPNPQNIGKGFNVQSLLPPNLLPGAGQAGGQGPGTPSPPTPPGGGKPGIPWGGQAPGGPMQSPFAAAPMAGGNRK